MPIKQVHTDQRVPVKIWIDDVVEKSRQQLANIASLPFIHHHVAAMPDVHLGIGATIGSVIATHKAIIPAAVGVDIGCGMVACRLSITANDIDERSLKKVFDQISRDVPVGRAQHDDDRVLMEAAKPFEGRLNAMTQKHPQLLKAFGKYSKWVNQMGSLGGGNHFIEVCLSRRIRSGMGHAAFGQSRHWQRAGGLFHRVGASGHGTLDDSPAGSRFGLFS
jgi:tRNA-splicing ligase RtcB